MRQIVKYISLPLLLSGFLVSVAHATTITAVTDPTSRWNAIPVIGTDPTVDQQTGQEDSDIVGTTANPAFYSAFESTNIYYRVRLGSSSSNNSIAYSGLFWIGIDANGDGALDLFIGVNNSGNKTQIGFYAPGTGTNTSPSTTSIANGLAQYQIQETSTNYDYETVNTTIDPSLTNADLDGGGKTDVFLSFMLPYYGASGSASLQGAFAGLANISIDGNSAFKYVIATSTQPNSLNQDLGGVPKNYNASSTWAQLGAITPFITPSGTVATPEPGTLSLLLFAVIGLSVLQLIRSRRFMRPECRLNRRS